MDGELCLYRVLSSVSVLFLALDINLRSVLGSTDVDQHLEMGKKMLAAGQLADALTHYHAAIDADPSNYMSYFRRATVYLALGKSKSALPDLTKVIELRPDFTAAQVQRGNVYLKQGRLSEAELDYKAVVRHSPNHEEAMRHIEDIPVLREEREEAKALIDNNQYNEAVTVLSKAIDLSPWDPELREMRADCYEHLGELFKAANDIKPTTKLRNDNTGAYLRLSIIYYHMGEAEESLTDIRECLKLDQDHKECHKHYKKVKKLFKQMNSVQDRINEQQWDGCLEKARAMMETEPHVHTYIYRAKAHICHCYSKAGRGSDAIEACKEVLEMSENDVGAICDLAEAYIANEEYQEAINEYQRAQNVGGESQRVQDGINRAQKLLKQSQKRDYYKILGVKRNAKKKEIMKAFRKLAMIWHPDKYEGDDMKKAEKKFLDIAAAKEVLTDPDKRQKFDEGEDPLDPEAQQGGHGNPFGEGFNPFGGGQGFNFKFHFG